jgi:hypothetical protein
MKIPQLLISSSLIMLGFAGSNLNQDPINDRADFYYPGANDELAIDALLAACQKNPIFEEAAESELFTNYVGIITGDGDKFSIGPRMSSDEGMDRLVVLQIWGVVEEVSEEAGAIFCNELNKANNVLSFTFHGNFFQTESNITFPNLLRAEHLVEGLGVHQQAINVALEIAYPDEGWKKFLK